MSLYRSRSSVLLQYPHYQTPFKYYLVLTGKLGLLPDQFYPDKEHFNFTVRNTIAQDRVSVVPWNNLLIADWFNRCVPYTPTTTAAATLCRLEGQLHVRDVALVCPPTARA